MTRFLQATVVIASSLASGAQAQAGGLEVYESTVGIGQVRSISGPVADALIDVDYAPATAEGGKLFGMSELKIETTGDLVLTPVGFICQAVSCLYSPLPFVAGKRILITAGNDLAGESAATANLLRFGLTGSTGHLVVSRGEYLDGTGPGASVGAVQTIEFAVLVTVPEPGITSGLAAACGLLTFAIRMAGCGRRSRASP